MGDGENPPSENFDFAMAYDDLDVTQKIQHLTLITTSIIKLGRFYRKVVDND